MKNTYKIQLTGTVTMVHESEVGNGSRAILKPFEGIQEIGKFPTFKGKEEQTETLSKTKWTKVLKNQSFDFEAFRAYAENEIEGFYERKKRVEKLANKMYISGNYKPVMKHFLLSLTNSSTKSINFKTVNGSSEMTFVENKVNGTWSTLELTKNS